MILNPKTHAAPLRSYWEGVRLEVVDAWRFRFHVDKPKFNTLRMLYLFAQIQAKQFIGESDFNTSKMVMQPVGNGLYRLKSFSRDQKLELERKKDWWGNGLPVFKKRFNADQIVFRIVTDPNLEYERWLKSDQDYMDFGPPAVEFTQEKLEAAIVIESERVPAMEKACGRMSFRIRQVDLSFLFTKCRPSSQVSTTK
jgi:ABC-type oligopeptide transport system substrate-binding subunit